MEPSEDRSQKCLDVAKLKFLIKWSISHIPCLCHTSGSPSVPQCMCAESLKIDLCCLQEEKENHMVFILKKTLENPDSNNL